MGKFSISAEVSGRLQLLGQRIRQARVRRGMTLVQLAEKSGINRNTLGALESGRPGVAIGGVITVLWALGLEKTFDPVADPDADTHGKALEASRQPKRVRRKQAAADEYDF